MKNNPYFTNAGPGINARSARPSSNKRPALYQENTVLQRMSGLIVSLNEKLK